MADTFTCNSCGKEMNTGYFYCPECHKKHREQDSQKNERENKIEIKET